MDLPKERPRKRIYHRRSHPNNPASSPTTLLPPIDTRSPLERMQAPYADKPVQSIERDVIDLVFDEEISSKKTIIKPSFSNVEKRSLPQPHPLPRRAYSPHGRAVSITPPATHKQNAEHVDDSMHNDSHEHEDGGHDHVKKEDDSDGFEIILARKVHPGQPPRMIRGGVQGLDDHFQSSTSPFNGGAEQAHTRQRPVARHRHGAVHRR